MPSLYIADQGAVLRKTDNRLVVEREGTKIAEIHDFQLERVVISGNVQITTQAMTFLLERGIDTALLTIDGRLKGRLMPIESKNSLVRLRQYERVVDDGFSLGVARAIVVAKVANAAHLVSRHARNHPEIDLSGALAEAGILEERAARAASAESLLGIEGRAAVVHFAAFARMLRRGLGFTKRTRRPPLDPVNAMLSYGYTLLYNEAIGALASVGFDPYLGFFHRPDYGRCSLALDLMEELRPIAVDRVALRAANREVLQEEDFERAANGGVYLRASSRKRYLAEYERVMTSEFTDRQTNQRRSLRRVLHDQALALRHTVLEGTPYEPFRGWR